MAASGENVLIRRLAIGLACLLALALASGCGGSSEQASFDTSTPGDAPGQAVLQAGQKTQALRSARISFTAEITGGLTSGTVTGDGALSGGRGRMSMDLSGITNGRVVGRMDMVFDGPLLYVKPPQEIAQSLPLARSWVKLDLARLGEQQGVDFAQLFRQLSGVDPTKSLDLLRASGTDFQRVGEEEVRGDETTHYRGTVDLDKVAQELGGELGASYRRIIELGAASRVPVDVWIDGRGLIRRLRYEQTLPGGSSTQLTEEFYDFGADVEIELPAANEVVDFTELMGNL